MEYFAYHFTVSPPQPGSEIIMAMIADQGFESFDDTNTGFIAYIHSDLDAQVDLSGFEFDDFTFTFSKEKIQQVNWNEEWEKNFDPVKVDDLVLIRAPFHESDPGVKHEIVIMPKMSFGTGHHQTTQMMCAELAVTDVNKKHVLDMGCGTGVLAILASMRGADPILAIDIDEWSVENSIENCRNNRCSNIIVKKGDVDLLVSETPFDLILANINKNVLKSHIPTYSEKLVSGGKLFLSGFFTTDVEELREHLDRSGLAIQSVRNIREWAMIHAQKS